MKAAVVTRTILRFMHRHVTIHTDEASGYRRVGGLFYSHGAGELSPGQRHHERES